MGGEVSGVVAEDYILSGLVLCGEAVLLCA